MQLVFDFGDGEPPRGKRCDRLFVGLLPGNEAADRIASFRQLTFRPEPANKVPRERLHVSVFHVRDDCRLRSKYVFAATRAAQTVTMPPFELRFSRLTSLPPLNPRRPQWPIVLLGDDPQVHALHRMLAAAMQRFGVKPPPAFLPHLTLAYGQRAVPPRSIDPIHVPVREFVLVHSEVGLTRYNFIDRWPLRS